MPHAFDHPYSDLSACTPLRGNLHGHCTRSDGADDLQTVINRYADAGYDILAMTGHDLLSTPEIYDNMDHRGMVLISGNEITAAGPHICHINASKIVRPIPQRQAVINLALGDAESLIVINHPNWQRDFDHCSVMNLKMWKGYHGIEIFNGVMTSDEGSAYATDKWDILLSEGRRIWGFANDDAHAAKHIGVGWNVAFARSRDRDGVMDALRHGRFYCSTGVTIQDITQTGDTSARIETTNAQRIIATGTHGRRLAQVDGPIFDFNLPEPNNWFPTTPTYVRFTCFGHGETMAWTQPFWIRHG